MRKEPVTRICAEILSVREHAVIGVSPFNSYFSEDKIAALVTWAKENFDMFHIYVPDGPSRFTLEALGYSEAKARKKANRQARWLFNKIRRGLDIAGCEEGAFEDIILCSDTLEDHDGYRSLLDRVETACVRDPEFHNGCIETSKWVLDGRINGIEEVTPEMILSAVRYFKAELPLFMNSPALVGVGSSSFIYHQCPPFLEYLFLKRRGDIIDERQGFVKITAK